MQHEEWTTSHAFRFWRIEIILHKPPYWGSLLRNWGFNTSGGLIATPFGGFYFS